MDDVRRKFIKRNRKTFRKKNRRKKKSKISKGNIQLEIIFYWQRKETKNKLTEENLEYINLSIFRLKRSRFLQFLNEIFVSTAIFNCLYSLLFLLLFSYISNIHENLRNNFFISI